MEKYANLSRSSAVESYEISDTFIKVKFYKENKLYKYSYVSAGKENIENMKILAINGRGLNSYINKYVRVLYER
jgi:hypothetical protein